MMASPVFHEDWFYPESQAALVNLFSKVADIDGDVVEVGSWEGRSTIVLAEAARPATVHAVDTWRGSPGEISRELAAQRDVFAQFKANTAHLDNLRVFRMGWRDYFANHAGPTRFLFIDAEHSYDEVRENIEAALPLMVAGAVICGDDVTHPPVRQAVIDTLGSDTDAVASLWWRQL